MNPERCGNLSRNQPRRIGNLENQPEPIASASIPVYPLHEQRRIVAYLDGLQAQVDALKKLQTQTAAELDALLPAILDRAFKGTL